MGFLARKTPEEQAAAAAAKERAREEKAARKAAEQREQARQDWLKSPAGLARAAYRHGDVLFQCPIVAMEQEAVIVALGGGSTFERAHDVSAQLNGVVREGWELTHMSHVFVVQEQQSRDKTLASGQDVAVKGRTVGYYVFRRCDTNRTAADEPWVAVDADTATAG
jgi:hypothetical protein